MKVTLEWPKNQDGAWLRIKVDEHYSNKANRFVKHGGKVYVYKDRRVGTPVLAQTSDDYVPRGWVQVGRIEKGGNIFLGGEDEQSYYEYTCTPEAIEQSRKMMEALQRARFPNVEAV
jgi:hypothetical protein